MRVLLLSKALVSATYRRKLEALARLPDIEILAVSPPYWDEARVGRAPLEAATTPGYTLRVERMALNGHHHVHWYPWLGRQVRAFRPDVFHIDEEAFNLSTAQAMWLGQRAGAACLFYNWANIDRRYPPPFSLFERYNFRHAAAAIAGNQEAADLLRRRGFKKPLAVIPQVGVDLELFRPQPSGDGREDAFRIGFIGRLVAVKGLLTLLDAAARLEGSWRLVLVGRGELRLALEQRAEELGVRARVEFVDWVPSAEVPAYLRTLDALVLPSLTTPTWKEQFGRVLVEAMGCGVPVVGSDSGEIPRVIGEAGLIFPEGNVAALHACLRELQHDPVCRQRLSAAGRERANQLYAQPAIARQYYDLYRSLVKDLL